MCVIGTKMCKNLHVQELCVEPSCNNVTCTLRHPVTCKFFRKYNRCKFDPCAYKHVENNDDIDKLKNQNQTLSEKIKAIDNLMRCRANLIDS